MDTPTERRPGPPSPLAYALAFVEIGLTSIGGAAAALRYVLVVRRRWIGESDMAETMAVAQALPGATGVNICTLLGDRWAGPAGVAAGLAGLCLPSLLLGIGLTVVAFRIAAGNPRFVAFELGITSAVAGLFIANGIRVVSRLWTDARSEPRRRFRLARLGVSLAAVVLVAGLHVAVPIAVVVLGLVSFLVERAVAAGTA